MAVGVGVLLTQCKSMRWGLTRAPCPINSDKGRWLSAAPQLHGTALHRAHNFTQTDSVHVKYLCSFNSKHCKLHEFTHNMCKTV